ncbi:phosphoribosylglycinamide formyltransferase [Pontibacillus halophilus JSM 076056 = DSM 19796]|uniref:Phosphoribosylglycinamide formyltransferase n=1 Tax=Pontibacillus halophilus JSM 076056 = DSM 19796 TaxID=1385510 RepID=A0A0A5I319_9BACI|nr:phosphoribosylglycinamide formyltransferase [Pontibacillus halophilus]KGX90237.1 phosphoribosylglycinamide formyltransferase [Pontibacillus halophilus JSM 076056 = DSM 19796]
MSTIAVFGSGRGTNFDAIFKAVNKGEITAKIGLVVSDKPDAPIVEKATEGQIPVFVFQAKNYESKAEYEAEILASLRHFEVDWVVLAGYMRLIGETLLRAYEGRIINLHPSYLPQFKGKDAVGQALAAGVSETGVTVHYVDAGMDTGPIIEQRRVSVEVEETHASLTAKIQAIEHDLYPAVIQTLVKGE